MQNPHDHQQYAVKELTNLTNEDGSTDRAAMNELIGEVRKMGAVSSEFVVRYHTSAIYDGRFYVMMDPIKGAEFRDVVVARQTSGAAFSAAQLKAWVGMLAEGLAHLHGKCKLVHQDLHNGNVMITGVAEGPGGDLVVSDEALAGTSIKILDLGLASFKSDHEHGGTATRTMQMQAVRMDRSGGNGRRGSYIQVDAADLGGFKAIRAPEMQPEAHVRGQVRFNAKTDVWALGILLVEAALLLPIEQQVLLLRTPLYRTIRLIDDPPHSRRWYSDRPTMQSFGRRGDLQAAKLVTVTNKSEQLGDVLARMMVQSPDLRISAAELADFVVSSMRR